mgnify:CR=1 FL=1|jgi:hypothetical protein
MGQNRLCHHSFCISEGVPPARRPNASMTVALENAGAEDGSSDLLFGAAVLLLICVGFILSNLYALVVPLRKAMLRSSSCASLVEMPASARKACITMLAEFEAKTDPIAKAAKEARSEREGAKRSHMPRVASLPTLCEAPAEEEAFKPSPGMPALSMGTRTMSMPAFNLNSANDPQWGASPEVLHVPVVRETPASDVSSGDGASWDASCIWEDGHSPVTTMYSMGFETSCARQRKRASEQVEPLASDRSGRSPQQAERGADAAMSGGCSGLSTLVSASSLGASSTLLHLMNSASASHASQRLR